MIYSLDKKAAISVVQITDCHLYNKRRKLLSGVNPYTTLRRVIRSIKRQTADDCRADLVLATGDLTQNGDKRAYQLLLSQLNKLSAPFFWLPGNHDNPAVMMAASDRKRLRCKQIMTTHWQILLLDSRVENQTYGELSSSELTWLQAALLANPNKYSAIFVHHPLLPVGSEWIDALRMRNAEQILALLDQTPQLRLVCNGHVHQACQQQRAHYTLLSTPSTCVQFKPNCTIHMEDNSPPAYRHLMLRDDGSFATEVTAVNVGREHGHGHNHARTKTNKNHPNMIAMKIENQA